MTNKKYNATILAELTGYGATSDGYDMVAPSGEGVIDKFTQDDINQTIEFMIDLGYPIEEALKQTNAFKKKYGISEEVK